MSEPSTGTSSQRTTVLIAEDSATQAEQLMFLLAENGHAPFRARNGREAIEMARKLRPAIVISDVVMPEMDGYGLCHAIKADPDLRETPVILVTTMSSPNDVLKGLNAGADNFLVKPYEEAHLLSRINYLLANQSLRRQGRLQVGIEIELSGQRHFITAERHQILDLLISTFDQAVRLYDQLDARQKDLTRSYATLNALYDIADGLNRCHTEAEVAESALEKGLALPGVRAGWLFLREGKQFRLAAQRGMPADLDLANDGENLCHCQRRQLDDDLAQAVNVVECERLARHVNAGGLRYHATIPLIGDGETIGMLNLVGIEQHMFSDEELRTLSGVGNQIAIALERARLHERLERKVAERTQALRAEVIERRLAEETARTAEQRLRDAIESVEDAFVLWDADDKLALFNRRYRDLHPLIAELIYTGVPFAELLQATLTRGLIDLPAGSLEAHFDERMAHHQRADGTPIQQQRGTRWIRVSERRTRDGGIAGIQTDVTDLETSTQAAALRARQQAAVATLGTVALAGIPFSELIDRAVQTAVDVLAVRFARVIEVAPDGARVMRAGRGWQAGTIGSRITHDNATDEHRYTVLASGPNIVADWSSEQNIPLGTLFADHGVVSSATVTIPGPGRAFGSFAVDCDRPRAFTGDDVNFLVAVANVIGTALGRQHQDEGLRQANETITAILDASPVAIITLDRAGVVVSWNRAAEAMFGHSAEIVIGQPYPLVPDGDGEEHAARLEVLRRGGEVAPLETRQRARNGSLVDVRLTGAPLHDAVGQVRGGVLTLENITERRRVEEQLRQSQKMEAIGSLTGGIAHDFNNLLTIIVGNLDLITGTSAQNAGDTAEPAQSALEAALRGADLTRRLLAFARRQTLEPAIVDVNRLIQRSVKLLRRTLGEHIQLHFAPQSDAWPAIIDAAQLDSAIVNLSVNARDAMPGGGRLSIETRNVTIGGDYVAGHPGLIAGDYLCVSVTDSGSGIAPENLSRIFEPFFSTKETHRGTGLGLAMVYGFVKQSGGHITVYSEVGRGTTLRLYLPRATEASIAETEMSEAHDAARSIGGESILVVEDNLGVQRIVSRHLSDLGYAVVQAVSADEAIERLNAGARVDLVFSDVVMPGKLSGFDLARIIAEKWPHIRVLLTSGFPEAAVGHNGHTPGMSILSKPYRKDELARKIRRTLES